MPRSNTNHARHLVSISQAAQHLGVSDKTIRRRISDGTITGYRFGARVIRVDLADVEKMLHQIPTVGAS